MYPKRSIQGDGSVARPGLTSDRIRRRPKNYGRSYSYSYPIVHAKKRKTKTRAAAAHIAKTLLPASHAQRTPYPASIATNLRLSSRKRVSVHFEDYTDSSGMEDEDLMVTNYRSSRYRGLDNTSEEELSTPKRRKLRGSRSVPRREGLRPRWSNTMTRSQSNLHPSDDEPATSDEKVGPDETENGNDGDDAQNGVAGEDDADAEGEDDGDEDGDDDDDDDDDDGEDEQEGCRSQSDSNLHPNDDEPVTSDEKVGPDETENENDGDGTQNVGAGEDDVDAEGEEDDDGEEDGYDEMKLLRDEALKERDAAVEALRVERASLKAVITTLEARVVAAEKEVASLKEKEPKIASSAVEAFKTSTDFASAAKCKYKDMIKASFGRIAEQLYAVDSKFPFQKVPEV